MAKNNIKNLLVVSGYEYIVMDINIDQLNRKHKGLLYRYDVFYLINRKVHLPFSEIFLIGAIKLVENWNALLNFLQFNFLCIDWN